MLSLDLKVKAIRAAKWSSLGEILARVTQPLTILILARLLAPSDFGVVGVAMIAISVAETLQDLGLGKTLVQRADASRAFTNNIFWLNLISSAGIYGVIAVFAPELADFFKSPASALVLRVLCLRILVTAATAVHVSLLQKALGFRLLFCSRLAAAIVPAAISIPLALLGFGAWALVWGTLAGSLAQSLVLWIWHHWRPSIGIEMSILKEMFGFSGWVFGYGLLAIVIKVADSTIIGHFLGPRDLGLYRVGSSCIDFVAGAFLAPLQPVAYSVLARLQGSREALISCYLRFSELTAFLCLPIGLGLAALAPTLVPHLFGAAWKGSTFVFATFAVKLAIDWIVGVNPAAFTAIGRPDLNFKLAIAVLIISIPSFLLAAPYGLATFCVIRLLNAVLDDIINYLLIVKTLLKGHGPFLRAVGRSFLPATIMAAIAWLVMSSRSNSSVIALVGTISASVALYMGISWILNPEFFGDILSVGRILFRSGAETEQA